MRGGQPAQLLASSALVGIGVYSDQGLTVPMLHWVGGHMLSYDIVRDDIAGLRDDIV